MLQVHVRIHIRIAIRHKSRLRPPARDGRAVDEYGSRPSGHPAEQRPPAERETVRQPVHWTNSVGLQAAILGFFAAILGVLAAILVFVAALLGVFEHLL